VTFLGSLWWMLVALGVLVTFHEFGHFWVARRCGVKVLRFSVGFGRPLWSRHGKDGTEYVVAALPLGGYVRMLDEREATSRRISWTRPSTASPCCSGSRSWPRARPPTCCCAWHCCGRCW
jgi:RIP metalloprotease RseP